jgi:tetratricopeptide (TPR) repeat protein/TolB-like protein
VLIFSSLAFSLRSRLAQGAQFAAALCLIPGIFAHAQTAPAAPGPPTPSGSPADHARILLVLPFDNQTGQPSLDWIREAAADLLTSRFNSAGFAPMSRADRLYALDHLGLPESFQPSRASALKLAETLDADSIIVGSYSMDRDSLVVSAEIVDVPHLRISQTISASGGKSLLIGVFDSLAWQLTRQLDPAFSVGQETFLAAGKSMRLESYEQYIRGISEPDAAERQKHLEQAVKLSPDYSPAWMALGREEYTSQEYEKAAVAFSKVDWNGAEGLEAGFYRGMSLLFTGEYAEAEKSFANVARVLPLAEVVNNQAVAMSRQSHDGTALFVQAAADDPTDADYHFNLAVSLSRQGNRVRAQDELTQCLKLSPSDSEAQAFLDALKQPNANAATGLAPLERIARTFNAAAFRQAATMMEQMNAAALQALPPAERAQQLSTQAKAYLDRGLLLEAERLYRSAIEADPKSVEAHAGLAEVRQRTGDADAARKEAQTALGLGPSAQAYLVLARLDLDVNDLNDAGTELGQAMKLDPNSTAAVEVLWLLQSRGGQAK